MKLLEKIRNCKAYPDYGTDVWQYGKYIIKFHSAHALCTLRKYCEIWLGDEIIDSFYMTGTTNLKDKLHFLK